MKRLYLGITLLLVLSVFGCSKGGDALILPDSAGITSDDLVGFWTSDTQNDISFGSNLIMEDYEDGSLCRYDFSITGNHLNLTNINNESSTFSIEMSLSNSTKLILSYIDGDRVYSKVNAPTIMRDADSPFFFTHHVPEQCVVKVSIIKPGGELIDALSNYMLEAGDREHMWSPDDDLPAGIYAFQAVSEHHYDCQYFRYSK